MFTFNVGPSQISTNTKKDILELLEKDILQISHRSDDFSRISEKAIKGLREFFQIPKEYKIFYTDSATKSMEICIQNCCAKNSFHFVNGVFSQLFANISEGFNKNVFIDKAELKNKNNYAMVNIQKEVDFVAMTHTETSTGVKCLLSDISMIRKKFLKKILAIDITSSAGVSEINISDADLWFFSLQKCFGLPSGLAICIVSPQAYEKSLQLTNNKQHFSFQKMWSKMDKKYQTLSTPNIFAIYLLAKKIKRWNQKGGLKKNIQETKIKKELFFDFINKNNDLDFFIDDANLRADSLFYIKGKKDFLTKLHKKCNEYGIILGKGYGKELKNKTLRIANFPSIKNDDLEKIIKIIKYI